MTDQPVALEADPRAQLAIDLQEKTLKEIKSMNARIGWLVFFAAMSFIGGILTFLNDFMRAF